MIETDKRLFLLILKAALNGKTVDIDKSIEIEPYIHLARRQQVEALFIHGLNKSGVTIPPQIKNVIIQHAVINMRQMEAAASLFQVFGLNGVDYMPLKGYILKQLYSSPEMRSMGDLDILIKVEQYDVIRSLMISEGYEEIVESDHELIWRKNGILVELHKRLIPSYNKDYYAYFGDGWQLAKSTNTAFRYEMSHEDTFIYLFTHYAKHYRDSGVGIRQAIDLEVYRKHYPDMNDKYVREQMSRLQLDRFYDNTMHMLDVWFNGADHTEASELISDRLFDSGVFGNNSNRVRSSMLKKEIENGSFRKARAKNWLFLAFPSKDSMCQLYPTVKKHPFLLPWFWCVRIFNALMHKKSRIRYHLDLAKSIDKQTVDAYRDMLHRSGLDFNFDKTGR